MLVCLILLCMFSSVFQSIFKKQFNLHYTGGNLFFSALLSLFALLFFILTAQSITIRTEVLPYSFAFAFSYALCTVSGLIAIKCPLAITSLIGSYSLIIPTLYGILFLQEPFGAIKCAGIAFLLISLFLIRADSGEAATAPQMSLKWVICVILSFFSNGMCSVIQSAQQRRFSGAENSNFMVLSLSICVCILLVLSVLFERKHILPVLKKGCVWATACGICNGITNLLVMVIIASVASSVFFPVHSAGCLILISVISILIYKEKFISRQYAGLACGLAAVILLNI